MSEQQSVQQRQTNDEHQQLSNTTNNILPVVHDGDDSETGPTTTSSCTNSNSEMIQNENQDSNRDSVDDPTTPPNNTRTTTKKKRDHMDTIQLPDMDPEIDPVWLFQQQQEHEQQQRQQRQQRQLLLRRTDTSSTASSNDDVDMNDVDMSCLPDIEPDIDPVWLYQQQQEQQQKQQRKRQGGAVDRSPKEIESDCELPGMDPDVDPVWLYQQKIEQKQKQNKELQQQREQSRANGTIDNSYNGSKTTIVAHNNNNNNNKTESGRSNIKILTKPVIVTSPIVSLKKPPSPPTLIPATSGSQPPTTANVTAKNSVQSGTVPKHMKKKNIDPNILQLRYKIQQACRDNNLHLALRAYNEDVVTKQISLEPQSYYSLLNLCAEVDRALHIGTPKGGSSATIIQKKAAPATTNKGQNGNHAKIENDENATNHEKKPNSKPPPSVVIEDLDTSSSQPPGITTTPSSFSSSDHCKSDDDVGRPNDENMKQQEPVPDDTKIIPVTVENDTNETIRESERTESSNINAKSEQSGSGSTVPKGLVDVTMDEGTSMLNETNVTEQKDEKNGTNPIKPIDLRTRRNFATKLQEEMQQRKIPLTESAYYGLIRLCCKDQDAIEAERLLEEAEKSSTASNHCKLKVRLYTPLLVLYCTANQLRKALETWIRLSTKGFGITEKEYLILIECCCTSIMSRSNPCSDDTTATAISTTESTTTAALVMEKVLSELAEDVCVPSHKTTAAIIKWFQIIPNYPIEPTNLLSSNQPRELVTQANANENGIENSNNNEISTMLQQIHNPNLDEVQRIGPVVLTSEMNEWTINERCSIDTITGELLSGCLKGSRLLPINVSNISSNKMLQMNEAIVLNGRTDNDNSEYQGGGKGKKRRLNNNNASGTGNAADERKRQWDNFKFYIHQRNTKRNPIDVVIDGANVGYYETNFAGAPKHVNYYQIDAVVQALLKLKKSVLIVIHSRHFTPAMMPRKYVPLMQSWIDQDLIYTTPPGMNDDWFWLHAALVSNACVVTNDEMRDHHFQMLAPRAFTRWKERYQIHFTFELFNSSSTISGANNTMVLQRRGSNSSMLNDDSSNGGPGSPRRRLARRVVLTFPEPYSRRIQCVNHGFVIPHPKQSDSNRFLDGTFTADDTEPVKETYVCICPTTLAVAATAADTVNGKQNSDQATTQE